MLDGLRDLFLSALRGEEKADVLVRKWNIEVKAIQEIYDKARDGERISAEPKIIRCKDCKHYQFSVSCAFACYVNRCEITGFEDVDDDDFCSKAERTEDG